jgi:chemotaxis protein histidine kinase CheA
VNRYTRLFIQETGSYLEIIGKTMGRLGEAGEDQGALGDCHRLVHSIKGMTSFEEQESVASLTYALELDFSAWPRREPGLMISQAACLRAWIF